MMIEVILKSTLNLLDRRYLLFSGYEYYPCGGANDMKGVFKSTNDALLHLTSYASSEGGDIDGWAHIVDAADMSVVARFAIEDSVVTMLNNGEIK
tara:strand:- start:217 stop:501 length:285 start_codon:yes stop_codon:yes gene_type:complete